MKNTREILSASAVAAMLLLACMPLTLSGSSGSIHPLVPLAAPPPLLLIGAVGVGGQPMSQIAVNPNSGRVYIAGGFAQAPLMVINASNPAAPAIVTTIGSAAGGVAVNPVTNRFYTSAGFGGAILVFDGVSNAQIGGAGVGFCGGILDVNVAQNRIAMISQCGSLNDPVHVMDGNTNGIIAGPLGSGGVANAARFNAGTGKLYAMSSVGTRAFLPPAYGGTYVLTAASLQATNPLTNRLYFNNGEVRDGTGTPEPVIGNLGIGGPTMSVNTALNHVYVGGGALITVIDGATNGILSSVTVPVGFSISQIAADSVHNLLFVAATSGGGNVLFVYQEIVPTLTSIAVTPANPTLNFGSSLSFTATGTFSDSSSRPLTPGGDGLTWGSSNPAVSTIDATGLASGTAAGTSTITATSGIVSGNTLLTVVPVLTSITVTPANPTIFLNTVQPFTATGGFNDASSRVLTVGGDGLTWGSSAPGVSTIDANGLATGTGSGASTITATSGSVTGNTLLTVQTNQQVVAQLKGSVQSIVTAGRLRSSYGALLIQVLDTAAVRLNQGNTAAAKALLRTFNSYVNSFVGSGAMTAADGSALLLLSNAVIANPN